MTSNTHTKPRQITKRRRTLARALERASVTERPCRCGHGAPYVVHPDISTACAPSLLTIASAIRDETRPLNEETLDQVLVYITDGASPFFGRDVPDALQEAVRLQHLIVPANASTNPGDASSMGQTV